jgi:hypothetical protein
LIIIINIFCAGTVMIFLACLAAALAATLGYLRSPHQRLLPVPAPRGFKVAAWVAGAISVALAVASAGGPAGVAIALCGVMAGAVGMPYLAWWLRPRTAARR